MKHWWQLGRSGRGGDPAACAAWLRIYGANSLRCAGIACHAPGPPPSRGMIVSNHLSYLDIAVLASTGPMVFVSKAEVASWPFLGSLARCGGTLFLKRGQRSHVAEIAAAFRPIIEAGTVVTLFPEGTSSGGDRVLPFRPSLLEPAAANGWPVTPAWVTYDIDPGEGTLGDDVAYWRDMTFAPHFLNLLAKRSVRARVYFGPPLVGITDRKELARRLHEGVCALRDANSPGVDPRPSAR